MTSSGCSRSEWPITFGTTTCPSSCWMPRKSSTTHSAEIGCVTSAKSTGGAPPSHGPTYGISSVMPAHVPKRSAYLPPCGSAPTRPRIQRPTPELTPMMIESSSCPLT